jgi:hypothetical protein
MADHGRASHKGIAPSTSLLPLSFPLCRGDFVEQLSDLFDALWRAPLGVLKGWPHKSAAWQIAQMMAERSLEPNE